MWCVGLNLVQNKMQRFLRKTHIYIIQEKMERKKVWLKSSLNFPPINSSIHLSTHSFNASQCLLGLLGVGVGVTLTRGHRWTWEAGVAGCCHPDRTRSYVSLDHSRFAKVRSRRFVPSAAAGASMSLRSQAASPRPLFHVWQGSPPSTVRLAPLLGALRSVAKSSRRRRGMQGRRKAGKQGREGRRCRICSGGTSERRINTEIGAVRIR